MFCKELADRKTGAQVDQIDKFKKIRTESFDDVEKNKEEILNIVMKNVFN